jgi:hypothetical protein
LNGELARFARLLKGVDVQVQAALSVWAAIRPSPSHTALRDQFEETAAGQSFIALQEAARWQFGLITWRVWDNQANAVTLPTLFTQIEQPALRRKLFSQCAGSGQIGANVEDAFRRVLSHYAQWRSSSTWRARKARLDSFRNQWLAHRQVGSPLSKARTSGATVADAIWCLGAASFFVERLREAARMSAATHREHRRIRSEYSAAFWAKLLDQPPREVD